MSTTQTCPACGATASGRFCSDCGTSLSPNACAQCGQELPPGARFCNECGAPAADSARPVPAGAELTRPASSPALPWIVTAAVAALALLVVLLVSRDREPRPMVAETVATRAPDISGMTPREAADNLFNRVMRSVEAGDTAEARAFAPMAIAAYGMARPLDLDGRYHLAVLHLVNDDPRAAREEAQSILDEVPTHLFGLFTQAQAEQLLGNPERSRALYQQFLAVFDTEVATDRQEYLEHSQILGPMRAEAMERSPG